MLVARAADVGVVAVADRAHMAFGAAIARDDAVIEAVIGSAAPEKLRLDATPPDTHTASTVLHAALVVDDQGATVATGCPADEDGHQRPGSRVLDAVQPAAARARRPIRRHV